MPGERIILHFVEFNPERARKMLDMARGFASSKPDGRPGLRHGTIGTWTYGRHDGDQEWSCISYWTASRTIVVRELPEDEP